MSNLLEVVQMAALSAVEQSKPLDVVFGTVCSAKPLEVKVDQKLTLTEEFLALTRSVSDYSAPVSCRGLCSANCSAEVSHGLKSGDVVVMLRFSGGQRYLILDKVVG